MNRGNGAGNIQENSHGIANPLSQGNIAGGIFPFRGGGLSQKGIDIPNAGDRFPVGILLGEAPGNPVVKPVQSVLQNLLLHILFAHGSGKEQVDVFFQLFSHKESFPSNR